MLPRPVAIGLAVLISFMWAVNLVVGYVYPDRSDPYVNAIFGTVVGAVFVLTRRAARRNAGGSSEPEALEDGSSDEEDER